MNIRFLWIPLLLLGACTQRAGEPAAPPSGAAAARDAAWTALARLPDWSGAWVKDDAPSTIFADCCMPGKGSAPLQPRYQAIRDRAAAIIIAGKPGGDNLSTCMPDGMPGILLHGVAFEFLNTPGRVTMITENGEVRRIYTDGRAHPPADELYTDLTGHSTGHWDDDTLSVDTIGMDTRAMVFLINNIHVTRQTHILERMRLKDHQTLQIDTTVTDPELFRAPYSYSLTYARGLREDNFIVGCMQNNRDSGGKTNLNPPRED
jgi:hypothetical protein